MTAPTTHWSTTGQLHTGTVEGCEACEGEAELTLYGEAAELVENLTEADWKAIAEQAVHERGHDLPLAERSERAYRNGGDLPCLPTPQDGHNCTLREGHDGPHVCCDGHRWWRR